MPYLKDNLVKQDNNKKLQPLNFFKIPTPGRYSISPIPSKEVAKTKPLSLYHRRNITSIIRAPYKHYSLIRQSNSFASESCKGFNPNNPSKQNQDSIIIQPSLNKETSLFGICDGHGQYGKEVSNFIALNLPVHLKNEQISVDSFTDPIRKIENDLKKCEFDVSYSGTTLVACCISKNILYSINIGDSRAVLGRRGYIKWEAIQLTRDHKPDLPDEANRIRSSGGRVASTNSNGPARVWMLEKNSPGLAMSRSLGDTVVHQIGVISDPEISQRTLTKDDEFLVIGSDGLFEFLSNQEIVVITAANPENPKKACEELVNTARSRWIKVKNN